MLNFSNKHGNIKKGTKAEEVWNSIEEFLRLILATIEKKKKTRTKAGKGFGQRSKPPSSPLGKIPKTATKTQSEK